MRNGCREIDAEIRSLGGKHYQAELFVHSTESIEFTQELKVSLSQSERFTGYGLRVIKDGKAGYASSNVFGKELVDRAIKACRVARPDRYNSLPSSELGAKGSSRNFEFKLADSAERIKDYFEMLTEPLGVNITIAAVSATNTEMRVISTEGVDVRERSSAFSAVISANYKEGKLLTPEIAESCSSTRLLKDPEQLRITVKRKIEAQKVQVELPRKFDEVVFTPKAVEAAISDLVESSFSGESLQRDITPMANQSKEKLDLQNSIGLADDPFVEGSTNCSVFDDEGLPKRRTVLVEDGLVKSFLYNTYWARRASVPGTNSASRTYQKVPEIATSNLVLSLKEEKDVTQDALVVDELLGSHAADPATGNFSLTASAATYKGQGVKDVVITGSLTELLRGADAMSDVVVYEGVVTGNLRVKGLSIS